MKKSKSIIILGASSDIGTALALKWSDMGHQVFGTYRTKNPGIETMENNGIRLVHCDISNPRYARNACKKLTVLCPAWDVLVVSPASLLPIGPFAEIDFNAWEQSIHINFTGQMRMTRELLSSRRPGSKLGPCVLFFSGGGINEAPINTSAYTISKIATIKMCELLDAEIPDTRFVTIGPGWVKTKIHEQMIKTGPKAGMSYTRTINKFNANNFTPMKQVIDCCDWIINTPRRIVGGRNFSVFHDNWNSKRLSARLTREPNLLKLRKHGSINKK